MPRAFPDGVLAEAMQAAARPLPADRADQTDLEMVTLDPLGATDLDQAFALSLDGEALVLHYAIADVGWFVRPGGALDAEAWKRGVTVYLPDRKTPLYPPVLTEGAASLLAGKPRPAILLEVAVDPTGEAELRAATRAVVRSRAQLAYETVRPEQLPPLLAEFGRRVALAEDRRGASRVEFPEQEVVPTPGDGDGYRLEIRPRVACEHDNAAMSLTANLAVAARMLAAGTGLFRTMDDPDPHEVDVLRRVAHALRIDWPAEMPLAEVVHRLPDGPKPAAFLLAVRRASGAASYTPLRPGHRPWHSAIAATYAHATAPLRRLADRYVLETVVALCAGRPVPEDVCAAYEALPAAMAAGDALAAKAARAAVDLAEAVVLRGRIGAVLRASVIDHDPRGVRIQLHDLAVIGRVERCRAEPGDEIDVRVVEADPARRRVTFAVAG